MKSAIQCQQPGCSKLSCRDLCPYHRLKRLERERLARGLCLRCGKRPRGTGKRGQLLNRCAECHEQNCDWSTDWRYDHLEQVRAAEAVREAKRFAASPAGSLLVQARYRAKGKGVPFTITLADVRVPTHCPLLGIPLRTKAKGVPGRLWDTPSLDRKVPVWATCPATCGSSAGGPTCSRTTPRSPNYGSCAMGRGKW